MNQSRMQSMKSILRVAFAFMLSFLVAALFSNANGRDLSLSLQSGLFLAILSAILVAILSWGIEIAAKKGYPSWLGFLLALIFNFLGLVILAILPNKTTQAPK
jgi:predicted neutral ceramidase superfamily lipid hydrolase